MLRTSFLVLYAACISALAILTFLLLSPVTFAQESEGLTISPSVVNERVEPGATYTFTLSIRNDSANERTLYLGAHDITGLNDEGVPVFASEGERTPYELSSWITLPEGAITFTPGETREVEFSVRVPADATPGGHFGGVFLDAQPPRLRTTGSGVAVRVATIMNLRVAGEAHEEARLREFSTDRLIYSMPDVSFLVRVENPGNVLLRPHGFIKITDMWGRAIGDVQINESGGAVFPLQEREFTAGWSYDGFAFGRYQAALGLVYGEDGRRTITSFSSFWVLPLVPLSIVLGSILIVLLALYVFTRMHINRKLRAMGISSRSGRAGAELYARRYQGPVSRLTVVFVAVALFSLIFLMGIFLLFA